MVNEGSIKDTSTVNFFKMNKISIKDASTVNFFKMNKRGVWRGYLVSIILGLMVLVFSLYFIFGELWSGDAAEREVCRESIMVRAALPDATIKGIGGIESFKDSYPLKCKTKVVEIDDSDIEIDKYGVLTSEKIAESMAECWALFDKGDSSAFPSTIFSASSCVPCARIHLTEDATKEFAGGKIDIRESLDIKMNKDYSYYIYLKNSGKKFSAFDFGNTVSFDLEGEGFSVVGNESIWDILPWDKVVLKNRLNGAETSVRMKDSANISLPQFFYIDEGDLLISYGVLSVSDEDFGRHVPYLFYFQTEAGDPFGEVSKDFIFNFAYASRLGLWLDLAEGKWEKLKQSDIGFCERWEGIPA